MHTRSRTFARSLTLLTSISSIGLLAACDMMDVKNPFADSRPPQQVNGARRMPALNPPEGVMPAPMGAAAQQPYSSMPANMYAPSPPSPYPAQQGAYAPPPPPPAPYPAQQGVYAPPPPPPAPPPQAAMRQAPSPNSNPYDYYDESGNPVGPKATAATENAPKKEGFFDRLFKKNDSSSSTTSAAPANAEQQPEVKPLVEPTSQNEQPATPVADASASSASAPSWLPHWLRSDDDKEKSAAPELGQKAPYPKLSSVPPTPPQFNDIKQRRAVDLADLKEEQDNAQKEKLALDSEPSQEETKPVQLIEDAPRPAEPAPKPQPQATIAPPPAPIADTGGVVLLGHAADHPLSETALSAEPPPPALVPKEVAAAKPAEAAPVDATQERSSWFDTINPFKRQPEADGAQAKVTPAAASAPAEQPAASDAPAVTPLLEQPSVAAAPQAEYQTLPPAPILPQMAAEKTPQEASPSAGTPATLPAVSVSAKDSPAPSGDDDSADRMEGGLPSPQILQDLRVPMQATSPRPLQN